MTIVLSFEEFKHRLEEEGKPIGADEVRTFDWLMQRSSLDADDCCRILELFSSMELEEPMWTKAHARHK